MRNREPRLPDDAHKPRRATASYALLGSEDDDEASGQGALIRSPRGGADAGIGVERAFRQIAGPDYRPLQTETIALAIAKKPSTRRTLGTVRDLLHSGTFRRELFALSGYDFSHPDDRLYET